MQDTDHGMTDRRPTTGTAQSRYGVPSTKSERDEERRTTIGRPIREHTHTRWGGVDR